MSNKVFASPRQPKVLAHQRPSFSLPQRIAFGLFLSQGRIVAILKHIASKNANYGSAIDYLKYQHDEFHLVPVLDERGNMLLREEFYLDGLNCHPETFDLECELLNQQYHKNNPYDEIKSHHYIISHDPRDNADHDLTGERAQAIGLEYAKANFPGHQALVCTHTDGNNGTGNIHTHIIEKGQRTDSLFRPVSFYKISLW